MSISNEYRKIIIHHNVYPPEETNPTYYVFFWTEELFDGEKHYRRESFALEGATSVIEANDWRLTHAQGRRSALILPQPRKNFLGMEYPGLIILAGEYPEGPELTGSLQGQFFAP
ncbi:hypothetical protein H7347_09670 [Corynebacterium sp. zg-331]|uniref:hypothetical protein n=1 Tax=unclassified Corynebacterium TaxID=2624378 RepID=UPI00128E0270|nr:MULTISPECIES: hypothetical protein [unclassified Corynebacterium]MBC3186828.1 hypothetical protein [Corynebacterium sp. zg-331]MPV53308.1 hypothetical protein [Corynebacterium sp. zg331]